MRKIDVGSRWIYKGALPMRHGSFHISTGDTVEVTCVYSLRVCAVYHAITDRSLIIETDELLDLFDFIIDPLPKGTSKDCPVIPKPAAKAASKIDFVGSNNLPIDLDYDDPWDNCVTYKRS